MTPCCSHSPTNNNSNIGYDGNNILITLLVVMVIVIILEIFVPAHIGTLTVSQKKRKALSVEDPQLGTRLSLHPVQAQTTSFLERFGG